MAAPRGISARARACLSDGRRSHLGDLVVTGILKTLMRARWREMPRWKLQIALELPQRRLAGCGASGAM